MSKKGCSPGSTSPGAPWDPGDVSTSGLALAQMAPVTTIKCTHHALTKSPPRAPTSHEHLHPLPRCRGDPTCGGRGTNLLPGQHREDDVGYLPRQPLPLVLALLVALLQDQDEHLQHLHRRNGRKTLRPQPTCPQGGPMQPWPRDTQEDHSTVISTALQD